MTTKNKFPGKLGKPRKYNPYFDRQKKQEPSSVTETTDAVRKVVDAIIKTYIEKETQADIEMFSLLLDHYKINQEADNKWMQLCYELALDCVPGFSYEKASRGRPKKWTYKIQQSLITSVKEYLKVHPKHSDKDACRHLAKKYTFQTPDPESLYQRYLEAKKSLKLPKNAL